MPSLGSRLLRAGLEPPEPRIVTHRDVLTGAELKALAEASVVNAAWTGTQALQFACACDLVRALVLLDGRVSDFVIIPAAADAAWIAGLRAAHGVDKVLDRVPDFAPAMHRSAFSWSAEPVVAPIESRWLLATSGTTGAPKLVPHTLAGLSRTVRPASANEPPPVWGLLFDPARFAGLQVVLQSLLGGGQLVCPDPRAPLGDRLAMLARHGTNHLSASPSLWRRILMAPEARMLALSQITLGGEIADQSLLGRLAAFFPDARVTHIYAATEVGVGFAVTDGLSGFPVQWLDRPPGAVSLRIIDGALWLRPPIAPLATDLACDADGYFRTADMVRLEGDRVVFVGREGGSVNVGGVKVQPEEVENVLRQHPGVAECRVLPRASSLLGAILMAEVVPVIGGAENLARDLRKWCRERLPREAHPATILLRTEIPTTDAGKLARPSLEEIPT